ncbi:M56 family metallopeptidase [Olivibacter domesticus]|uniref:TonB-dependent outer membrane receptor, SusC/RagA subfamily, signature region n=1 Tax=Olivibacter domesticus TaxID=407022 RepID=A0A1H7ISF8_OLID1|nr:M56 family metallopeptidase [Olivibacter domesticus]SEK64550.1 TonB-dependent outer membrane receptor, SusC/RagA subfamily, signature region [Olivibacter domesticus]
MPDLIIYLLKANFGITLFYLGYHFLLRRLTFYSLNRFYLLFGLLFSSMYPLFDFSFLLKGSDELAQRAVLIDWQEVKKTTPVEFTAWNILYIIFWATVLFLVVRFIIRLFALLKIHKQSVTDVYSFYKYRKVFFAINPFSFWKNIYINPSQHNDQEFEDILKHEYVHVEELHTVDVLIVEITSFLFWFNPFIWTTKNAIKENLEFITDQQVLKSGIDKKVYQYSLVNVITNVHSQNIGNSFNFKSLKRRIFMMNKASSSKINFGKYIFIIPAIILFVLLFTITKAYEEANQPKQLLRANSTQIADLHNLSYTDTIPQRLMNTKVTDKSTKEVENQIKRFTAKKKSNTKVTLKKGKEPLYVLDGRIQAGDLGNLSPDDIESVSILKDSSAIDLYGEKGENGVVVVTTKHRKNADQLAAKVTKKFVPKMKFNHDKSLLRKELMVLVDGKENPLALDLLAPELIESIEVIKGEKALLVLGSKGRDVVKITTKKPTSLNSSNASNKTTDKKSQFAIHGADSVDNFGLR